VKGGVVVNIAQTKKSWSTPVIRKLSGAEAEEARKLLMRQVESGEKDSAVRLR
jgi:hypothetical protein